MRQLAEIGRGRDSMKTMVDLTNIFQGISSMRISQVKNQIHQSHDFFDELWQIYSQIRIEKKFSFGRIQLTDKIINKELILVIASENSLSGNLDRKMVDKVEELYNSQKNDIIVVGRHGSKQLVRAGLKPKKVLRLPDDERYINAIPVMEDVQSYGSTLVVYQRYVSLSDQDVGVVDLGKEIIERGKYSDQQVETISEKNYIFEPSTVTVVQHLEQSMMNITISQIILDSKLAQFASRFQSMSKAHTRADNSYKDYRRLYDQVRRYIKDERLKEIVYSSRKVTT